MKIYFAASIRGGRNDSEIYSELIEYLKNFGDILSEHISDKSLTEKGSKGTEKEIHDQDLAWLFESDLVIAEVTNPSLGVGYELRSATEKNKKILAIYRPQKDKNLSAMIKGSEKIKTEEYSSLEEAKKIIKNFIENANKFI